MAGKKIYFPGLNGIRFLAALSVVIYHIELNKGRFRTHHASYFLSDFAMRGSDAVTLFFVLSGFLITYLLLAELRQTDTVNIRKFYARRILRIWPLYYLLVFIGFVGLPLIVHVTGFEGYWKPIGPEPWRKFWPYVLFLPNIVGFVGAAGVVGLGQMWSIGIEEQFYLFWPHVLKRFARHVLTSMLVIIILKLIVIHIDRMIVVDTRFPLWFRYSISFLTNFRIESMAVGGIGAYLLFSNSQKVLSLIFHPVMEKIVLFLMIGNFLWFDGQDRPMHNLALSVIYMLFILNVSCNPRSTVKLTHPILDRLGRVSYGMYMYHNTVIFLILMAFTYTSIPQLDSFTYNTILYALAISLTIGVSLLSYARFEKPLLRLKDRFTVIRSGDRPAEVPEPPGGHLPTPAPAPEPAPRQV